MINDKNRWKGGRGYKKHCFDIRDFAKFFGKEVQTLRNAVHEGRLDLRSLRSVFEYYKKS